MSIPPPPPPPGGMPLPPPPGMPPPPPGGPYGVPQGSGMPAYGSPNPYGTPTGYGYQTQQAYGYQPGPDGYAPWLSRVAAQFIDGLTELPFLLPAIGAFVAAAAASKDGTCRNYEGGAYSCRRPNGPLLALGMLLAVAGVIAFTVWYCRRVGRTGQSVGRKALGYKIVDQTTGQPIGAGKVFARMLVRVVDGLVCYLGYLWPLWDKEHQTFSDKIMHTIAVKA